MKLSPQWIREFVDLSVDDRGVDQDLTGVGIAVEGISGSGADTVFEMEIGTNRPDAMNHYGVAREAAAIYDLPLKQFSVLSSQFSVSSQKQTSAAKAASPTSHGATEVVPFPITPFPIVVEEPQLCPRFSARVISGTTVRPSREKIVDRVGVVGSGDGAQGVAPARYSH